MRSPDPKFNVLLLGGGGREAALAWAIRRSPSLGRLFIHPGNPGTAAWGTNVRPEIKDFEGLRRFCLEQDIRFVVPGPEAPLVQGIYDFFQEDAATAHIGVIGPSRTGALLEGSKAFAKAFMRRHGVPTAGHYEVTRDTLYRGFQILEKMQPPYVLKADGLAAGKGVLIVEDLDDAKRELAFMIGEHKFGEAGSRVLIEEYLEGVECSVFILTDGTSYKILPEAKDYKRIGEGNTGLNTGGMGAISPVPFVDKHFMQKVEDRIIRPTVEGLKAEGIIYKGFLYFGLMRVHGEPFVIEYNCRLGDPETEAILPRIQTDWVKAFEAVTEGRLHEHPIEITPKASAAVVLASLGYPEIYDTGFPITGLEAMENVLVFQAGTKADGNRLLTNGGRVLVITAQDSTLEGALQACYQAAERIHFDNKYFRRDIGQDVLEGL
ncbi:MAG: phosphoribosylamine--glycine ligase [Flavobacteriales bacterium]|nr:phosphoribosylamine--glycine ligase [Flavobacteriales bacterium]MCX7650572.1 phosphoribosylamine--glycine ligase [Flavobacteriales bacterium]MDW8432844.1 phosphoribosylamine--glycine ligase [Flavobacteriales bacterium]